MDDPGSRAVAGNILSAGGGMSQKFMSLDSFGSGDGGIGGGGGGGSGDSDEGSLHAISSSDPFINNDNMIISHFDEVNFADVSTRRGGIHSVFNESNGDIYSNGVDSYSSISSAARQNGGCDANSHGDAAAGMRAESGDDDLLPPGYLTDARVAPSSSSTWDSASSSCDDNNNNKRKKTGDNNKVHPVSMHKNENKRSRARGKMGEADQEADFGGGGAGVYNGHRIGAGWRDRRARSCWILLELPPPILPSSRFSHFWDPTMILCLVFTAVVTPVEARGASTHLTAKAAFTRLVRLVSQASHDPMCRCPYRARAHTACLKKKKKEKKPYYY